MEEERTEAWWGRRAGAAGAVHHQPRLHGHRRQRPHRRRRVPGHAALPPRDPLLHPALRRRLHQRRHAQRGLAPLHARRRLRRPPLGARSRRSRRRLALRPAVVRGNASEILALASRLDNHSFKGVDSSHDSGEALQAAKALARSSGAVIAVSGAVDFITDGEQVVSASNGVAMMQKITETGCAVTTLIAAFVGADPSDALAAAACALAIFGLAGEIGMESAKGPASLRMHLIDALYGFDEQTVTSGVKIALVP